MDVEKLVKALDNDENAKIMNMTSKKMNAMKLEILSELQLSKKVIHEYLKKLENYRYVDELDDLNIGRFIRWIQITDPENLSLSNGANICDIKITDKGIVILYKTFANKHYQLNMDECILFQKMTGQEEVILAALNHLDKSPH